jgi:UDP-glucose 6-dehydrogenase
MKVKHILASPHYSVLTSLGRKELKLEEETVGKEKLVQHVVDFEKLDDFKDKFANHDAAFICLGTTRKDAGSAVSSFVINFHEIRKLLYELITITSFILQNYARQDFQVASFESSIMFFPKCIRKLELIKCIF